MRPAPSLLQLVAISAVVLAQSCELVERGLALFVSRSTRVREVVSTISVTLARSASVVRVRLPEGHVVRVANDGEAGLRLLDESRPDAIVLDVEMPRLDGPTMAYRMFVHNAGSRTSRSCSFRASTTFRQPRGASGLTTT
jgi:DNA-binding NarL/FixJ family response regulator